MNLVIVDDDPISRLILEKKFKDTKANVYSFANGVEAVLFLEERSAPCLVLLDWMLPGMDGIDVCRRLQNSSSPHPVYIIMVTGRDRQEDIVNALGSGANDYLSKPYDPDELQSRTQVGLRTLDLQSQLALRVQQLEEALSQVKQLQGLLPICCHCKKIRDEKQYWTQVEEYVSNHSNAQFSHSICPHCVEKFYGATEA